jgi:hypothetical protein
MRRTLAFLAMLSALAPACKSQDNTKIVVAVWSDLAVPAELDTIRIDVVSSGGTSSDDFHLRAGGEPGKTMLPAELALVPLAAKDESFTVTAVGLLNTSEIVSQTALVHFIGGQALLLKLYLGRACAGLSCGADVTCSGGACDQPIVGGDLPPYDPTRPLVAPDAGDRSAGKDGSTGLDGEMAGAGGTTTGAGGLMGTGGNGGAGTPGGTGGMGTGGMDASTSSPPSTGGSGDAGSGATDGPGVDAPVTDDAPADVPSGRDVQAADGPLCGKSGQPCCDSFACDNGGCCSFQSSGALRCVAAGAACGDSLGGVCAAGGCVSDAGTCGTPDGACCTRPGTSTVFCTTANMACGGEPTSPRCVPCGQEGMRCCNVAGVGSGISTQSYCHSSSLTCKPSTAGSNPAAFCAACGGKGEACCGRTCNAGLTCVTPDGAPRDSTCE